MRGTTGVDGLQGMELALLKSLSEIIFLQASLVPVKTSLVAFLPKKTFGSLLVSGPNYRSPKT